MEEAQTRRDEVAERWGDLQPPGSGWTDDQVCRAASKAADRTVDDTVRTTTARADEEVKTADDLDQRVTERDQEQNRVRAANEDRAAQREALVEDTERRRAINAGNRAARARYIEVMSANDVVGADEARDVWCSELHPAVWRTAAELAREAQAIETRFEREYKALADLPVMKEEVCQDENRSERTAADEARGRSERHQAEAARFEVVRDKLVPQAATDYFAARDDARTIEAGPGRAASHAKRPRSTKPRPTAARSPSAGTRPGFRLPGSTWSDDHVRRRAGEVAKRIVDSGVRNNTKRAEEQVKTAAALEHRIALRDYRQESARVTNGHRPGQRQALIEDTEQRRAINAEARKTRVRHTEAMSPNDVVGADRARDQLVTKERFRRQSAEWAASISHDRSPSRDSDRSYGMEL